MCTELRKASAIAHNQNDSQQARSVEHHITLLENIDNMEPIGRLEHIARFMRTKFPKYTEEQEGDQWCVEIDFAGKSTIATNRRLNAARAEAADIMSAIVLEDMEMPPPTRASMKLFFKDHSCDFDFDIITADGKLFEVGTSSLACGDCRIKIFTTFNEIGTAMIYAVNFFGGEIDRPALVSKFGEPTFLFFGCRRHLIEEV
jgi:hypothetical protein